MTIENDSDFSITERCEAKLLASLHEIFDQLHGKADFCGAATVLQAIYCIENGDYEGAVPCLAELAP